MAVIMAKELQEKLERVKEREWWPVARLAEVLGRPKCFIYRSIDRGNFDVIKDGEVITKVLSRSVTAFYENHMNPISTTSIERQAFKRGFYEGLEVSEKAQELGISLDKIEEIFKIYNGGE